jgi:glycosyltransferase involved in cell wall biosynthesis
MALLGQIDDLSRGRLAGWAQDDAEPAGRVALLITADDELLMRVLADRTRDDLRAAGIGDGRYSFDVQMPPLAPGERHVIAVRSERDGAHLHGSPAVVEPVQRFDATFQAHIAGLLAQVDGDDEIAERFAFLTEQAELLRRRQADRRARRAERTALRQIKWRESATDKRAALPPRALVIDETMPRAGHDAGSNAVLSHMRALQHLGFEVTFAAADMTPDATGVLEATGIAPCHAPWHGSVEEVLRREGGTFDLVYLHRASVALRYLALARYHQPKTRIVYSVADLHHLRYARQAQAEHRPELLALAREFQVAELRAAEAADAVITHSSAEAELLRRRVPKAHVHVIPWAVPTAPTAVPFAERRGLAFVGHFGHAPNTDAAQWLIDDILPRVRTGQPDLPCLLAGTDMPDILRQAPGVEALGEVAALAQVFDRVRLTIAPMAYGAGIKGKVLDSLAAGIPCVCTPVAAEGLVLPAEMRDLVAADAEGLAAAVIRLHEDAAFNQRCARAGLAYIAAICCESRIDALMRSAAGLA